ncbi:MAG TPA: hypothetical protein VNZ86_02915 [Bacteroidia bacterium]|nr:hypothetical protein [Bacteroidia bacterium]
MEALNLNSWSKAATIYRWNLVLTVIMMAVVIPRIFPIGSAAQIFTFHIQWRAVVMFPLIYVIFTLLPFAGASLLEGFAFLVRRKYLMNEWVNLSFGLWIVLVLMVLLAAMDVTIFHHEHHLRLLLSL